MTQRFIQQNLAGVEVVLQKDRGITGNFDVFADGTLVHSKKKNGDGFVDSEEKANKMMEKIKEL